MLEKLNFKSFEFNSRKEVLIGIDENREYVIKIEVSKILENNGTLRVSMKLSNLLTKPAAKRAHRLMSLELSLKNSFMTKLKKKKF